MNAEQITLVQASFPQVAAIAAPAAALFYRRLFEIDPGTKPLFRDTDMEEQGRKLMASIGMVVANLNRPEVLGPAAQRLGRAHADYGVRPEQYDSVGAALLWTLEQGLGEGFTSALRDAWAAAYAVLAGEMRTAA